MNVKQKVQTLNLGQFWAFWDVERDTPAYNPGRDDKDSWQSPLGQIPPDMAGGYDMSQGTIITYDVHQVSALYEELNKAYPCELYEAIAADPVAVAMAQRQQRVECFLAIAEKTISYPKGEQGETDVLTMGQIADVYDHVLKVKPTDFAQCGQRRTYAAPGTIALALLQGGIENVREYEFYATRRKFESVASTHDMLATENAQNSRATYSPCGLLRNAIDFLSEVPGISELDLGRKLGLADRFDSVANRTTTHNRGNRQKYHRWAMVSSFPPNKPLDIYGRVAKTVSTDDNGKLVYTPNGGIPAGKLDKETAQVLLGATKNGVVVPRYVPILGEKNESPASPVQVELVLKALISGHKPPVIDRRNMESWNFLLGHVTVNLGDVLTAIVKNDFAFFNNLDKTPSQVAPSQEAPSQEVDTPAE